MAGKHQRGVSLHASLVAEPCFGTQLHLDETRLRRAPPGEASASESIPVSLAPAW